MRKNIIGDNLRNREEIEKVEKRVLRCREEKYNRNNLYRGNITLFINRDSELPDTYAYCLFIEN